MSEREPLFHISRRFTAKRRRRVKPEAEVVLLCNPRAGGRWKELAKVLDAEEARYARRIVTDSVEDVAMALDDLGHDAKLLCIYGGDGTIQRILDRLSSTAPGELHIALLGGGTMNVTSRWLGFTSRPADNFRHVVRAYRAGELLWRDVPLLEIETDGDFHRGFTFGMGPIIRLLDHYENGRKGKVAAVGLAARALAATWLKQPSSYERMLRPMNGRVWMDDEALPYDEYAALFANVTGQINPGVEPFVAGRTRESFYCAAYAVSPRELTMALPMLIRGWLPIDVPALVQRAIGRGDGERGVPKDARYVNRPAGKLRVESDEQLYTIDGEILHTESGAVDVGMGPTLKLAAGPGLEQKMRLAAESMLGH